jgi:hypothetical protein
MEEMLGYMPRESVLHDYRQHFTRELNRYTPEQQSADEATVQDWIRKYGELPRDPF